MTFVGWGWGVGVWMREVPVVQQNVGPPDLVVREADVSHSWIVGDVPAQVDVRPVLRDKTAAPSFRVFLLTNSGNSDQTVFFAGFTFR